MEDTHVIPGEEESEEKEGGTLKKVLIGAGIVVFLLVIGGGSYFFGRRGKPAEEEPSEEESMEETQSPTPTLSPTATLAPGQTATVTPTPTSTPTPTPTPVIKTETISSKASLDGWRASNGGGNTTWDIRIGRNVNLVQRGFLSFDLSSVPSGATIEQATLRVYQHKIVGNPYGVGGNLKVDHLNYGDSLDGSDYGSAAILSSFATMTSNATVEWKDADVTERLKDDINNTRSNSQYRIHFTTENSGGTPTGDFAYFESGDNFAGTGKTPELVVKYY